MYVCLFEQGQYKVISSGGIKGEGLAVVALYIRKDLVKAMVGYRAISGRFMHAGKVSHWGEEVSISGDLLCTNRECIG